MSKARETVELTQDVDSSGNLTNDGLTETYASNAYVQVYVSDELAALVDSAPTTLDTLNELAAALGDDPNFATTVTNTLATKAANTYVNTTFASNNYTTSQLDTKVDQTHTGDVSITGTIEDDVGDVRTPRHSTIDSSASTNETIANEGVYQLSFDTPATTITIGAPAAGTIMCIYNNKSSSISLARGSTVSQMRKGADNNNTNNTTLTLAAYSLTTITMVTATRAIVTGTDVS